MIFRKLAAIFLLSAATATTATAQMVPQQGPDVPPVITVMVDNLSGKFRLASGQPFTEEKKAQVTIDLMGALQDSPNIREGYCRDVMYGISHEGVSLTIRADICRQNGTVFLGPRGIQ